MWWSHKICKISACHLPNPFFLTSHSGCIDSKKGGINIIQAAFRFQSSCSVIYPFTENSFSTKEPPARVSQTIGYFCGLIYWEDTMVEIKEMPYSEKYAKVMDSIDFDEKFILPFVRQHLGEEAASDIKKTWQEGAKPIPKTGSFEDKYETAYSNWIWLARNTFHFIREQMGEEGIERFERAEVEALKKKNASPALLVLRLVRFFSPGTAFTMTSKQMGYQLQWLSPFTVTELTPRRTVFDVPRCKVLDYPDTEDLCFLGCQGTYPIWIAEQFKVELKWNRQGNSCKGTLTPLS